MQAMILAAGFGTRLLPYTKICPKPLFPILNKPLLLLSIERLQKAGFTKVIVNCHHLADKIAEALDPIAGVFVQREESILGTGGGLRRAFKQMSDEPLLITNGDIYHTIPYEKLYAAHLRGSQKVTLAIHDYPRFNGLWVDKGNVISFEKTSSLGTQLAFTGLHMIEPEILEQIPTDKMSCILELYRKLIVDGQFMQVHRTDDCFWTDMGTPADYLQLHEDIISKKVPAWEELGQINEVIADKSVLIPESFSHRNWCVIGENAILEEGVSLDRTVVWDNTVVAKGKYSKTIITNGVEA